MIILTLRTDKPEAEVGLFDDQTRLGYTAWQAHRRLAETIHHTIEELLKEQDRGWADIGGVICFEGPGSFTGLRIGLTIGNTLAYSYGLPIVATKGEKWQEVGRERLLRGESDRQIMPFYGADAHITAPKK